MVTVPLKELVKIQPLLRRLESGAFDANDVDSLLIKLRPYSNRKPVLREVADFVAHADERSRGLACASMTGFADAMRFFVEYTGASKALDITQPFPAYVRRLFLSQAVLANETELRARFRLSHQSLVNKIKTNFTIDGRSRSYRLRPGKYGSEFLAALQYVSGFIHSRPAFAISDVHTQLHELLTDLGVPFEAEQLRQHQDRISLALLCLLSGTEFELPDGDAATCCLATENHFRILAGRRRLPVGDVTSEPARFGTLQIRGEIQVVSAGRPLRVAYPVVTTTLDPHDHCDPSLFQTGSETNEFGEFRAEVINFAPHMAISQAFKLVPAVSA